MNVAFAVDVPPALLKKSTSTDVLPFEAETAIVSEPILEPDGSETPDADNDIFPPVPSEDTTDPP